jgi:hypothetical protein
MTDPEPNTVTTVFDADDLTWNVSTPIAFRIYDDVDDGYDSGWVEWESDDIKGTIVSP